MEATMTAPPAPPMGAQPPQTPPGSTAPATMRPDNQGSRQQGRIMVALALKALMKAVEFAGPMTDEGQTILKAASTLSAKFGKVSGDITRAESKLMGERAPAVTQPGPENINAMQQKIRQDLASRGVGAA